LRAVLGECVELWIEAAGKVAAALNAARHSTQTLRAKNQGMLFRRKEVLEKRDAEKQDSPAQHAREAWCFALFAALPGPVEGAQRPAPVHAAPGKRSKLSRVL